MEKELATDLTELTVDEKADLLIAELDAEEKAEKKRKVRKEFFRTIKYFCVAASAGIIQLGTFTLFEEALHLNHWVSYIISLVLSVIWNFTINRKVTFKSANNVPIAMFKVICYYAVFAPLSTWWTKAINDAVAGMAIAGLMVYIVEVCTILTNGITEFLYQRFFVFGKSVDQTEVLPVGEIGKYGEITVEKDKFSGAELNQMMSAGLDINTMKDKELEKWLRQNG